MKKEETKYLERFTIFNTMLVPFFFFPFYLKLFAIYSSYVHLELPLLSKHQNILSFQLFLQLKFASCCIPRQPHFLFNLPECCPLPAHGPSGIYDWDLALVIQLRLHTGFMHSC